MIPEKPEKNNKDGFYFIAFPVRVKYTNIRFMLQKSIKGIFFE
jgi:hypothetical protein